ncbi:MAG: arginase [Planctomycetota bacterium]|jgi:arginase
MTHQDRKHVRVIGVPMDLGAGRRGVDMGPSGIRIAGLDSRLSALGYIVADEGDLDVPAPEVCAPEPKDAKYLTEIRQVCEVLCERVGNVIAENEIPVVLGGDHSLAIGSVSGVAKHYKSKNEKIGLIWVDAHADINTPETSLSGNIHGMPLAALLGMGESSLVNLGGFAPKVLPENTCLIGIRNLDHKEKEIVIESGVNAFTMRDIDQRGMASVMEEAIERASAGTVGFHLSFDLDGVDPREAPGVGTAVRGGINWRESHLLAELVADSGQMLGLEITELNPILDHGNKTGELAVEMVLSAFGQRIL